MDTVGSYGDGYRLTQAICSVTRQLAKQLFISPDVLVGQVSYS